MESFAIVENKNVFGFFEINKEKEANFVKALKLIGFKVKFLRHKTRDSALEYYKLMKIANNI